MGARSPTGWGMRRQPSVGYLTPPRLASLPAERSQLEYSSRSLVFAADGRRLLRAWGPPDRPFVIGVAESGARWRVEGWGVDPSTARRAVRDLFSLDHPLEAFYAQTRVEPVLRSTGRRFRGLRLPRDSGIYEALLHAIIGQQLSVVAANTIKGRLFAATGARIEVDGTEVPRVPTPAEIRALEAEGLRRIGLSRAKTVAVLALAHRQDAGAFASNRFADGPVESAVERLDAEPGVGRWTAENALLRGVGRTDLFVAGDLGVRVALERYGVLDRDRPEVEARAWGDRWYPGWGSYATLYLWRRLVSERTTAG